MGAARRRKVEKEGGREGGRERDFQSRSIPVFEWARQVNQAQADMELRESGSATGLRFSALPSCHGIGRHRLLQVSEIMSINIE